jgi:universal stress protein E
VVESHWEKRVGDWVIRRTREEQYDLVIKTGHRTETFLYTPTDWQLLRGCRAPVLLVAGKRWTKATHVMAAVDLGTRVPNKRLLNYKIVGAADELAKALDCELHVGYAVPFSRVMRDLDLVDKWKLLAEGRRLARSFQASLAERGIDTRAIHVRAGPPEKVLVSMAARHRISLVVLGCIGRKRLAGRVVGNTAEQILRLMKADVLALKP